MAEQRRRQFSLDSERGGRCVGSDGFGAMSLYSRERFAASRDLRVSVDALARRLADTPDRPGSVQPHAPERIAENFVREALGFERVVFNGGAGTGRGENIEAVGGADGVNAE